MNRSVLAMAAVLVVAVFAGGWLLQEGVEQEENLYLQVRLFEEVVDHVSDRYVDEVDEGELYQQAIEGLLQGLDDPNTSFIRASDYENFRIQTQGDYGGIGLEIINREGWVVVQSAIPGTPGARAGLRAGDRFVEIGGQDAEGWSTDQAVEVLRGEPGTDVGVKVRRVGVDEPIDFTLTRARIQLRAVPFALLLDDRVGYVPLQIFREASSSEVEAAVDSLRSEGMEGLILDLRGNPGGLLEEGIAVTDLFLEEGSSVLETRGRARGQDERYTASDPGFMEGLPVVVLVDEVSASAAEILAGALQDHDRAVVVGNTTFGKGSVQTLFHLTGGNVLRLTTARWYTPVGRSIDRHGDDDLAVAEPLEGTLAVDGRVTLRPDTTERPTFESMGGRTLYGGGGITPDVVVLPDTLTGPEEQAVRTLYRQLGVFNRTLFDFAARYTQARPELEPDFAVTPAMLEEFRGELVDRGVSAESGTWERAERFVRYQLAREIALRAWGEAAAFRRLRSEDAQLRRARELLGGVASPEALLRVAATAEGAADRVGGTPAGTAATDSGGGAGS